MESIHVGTPWMRNGAAPPLQDAYGFTRCGVDWKNHVVTPGSKESRQPNGFRVVTGYRQEGSKSIGRDARIGTPGTQVPGLH